ncbi:MAG: hypothetical protein ABI556_17170, partial [Gemmatimonadales bacterium]
MQTSTQEAVLAPAVAQSPATVSVPGADGKLQILQVPRSSAEVAALVDRRNELSSQLSNVNER